MTAKPAIRLPLWGLTIAMAAMASHAAGQQGGVQVLEQLEGALGQVIQRCERSVVSITRTSEPLEALLAQNGGGLLGGVPQGAKNRIVFPQQPRPLLRTGGLQSVIDPPSSASGAGVVFDTDEGLILTQYRVVKLGETHFVTDVEGQRYTAKIRAADPRSGLAILAIDERFPPGTKKQDEPFDLPALPIGQAEGLKKGRIVIAIGNPFSIETDGQATASWGSVTNTAMKAPSNENFNDSRNRVDGSYRTTLHHFGSLIQTDAKLGWNASGGALVNLDGELIGITTTAAAIAGHEQPAGYAIPLNEAMRRAVASMRQGVEPEYGLLGVQFSNAGAARSRKTGAVGIAVGGAFQGGPAQRAGLRKNDLLIEVAGKPVISPEALQLTVGSLSPGLTVPVKYERNGEQFESTVKLGKAYIREGQIVSRSRLAWRGILVDYATAIPPEILGQKAASGHLDEEGCVVVRKVEEGSISWKSGVRPYRFISHVSGRRVTTPAEFYEAVRDEKDNVKLKFTKPPGGAGDS